MPVLANHSFFLWRKLKQTTAHKAKMPKWTIVKEVEQLYILMAITIIALTLYKTLLCNCMKCDVLAICAHPMMLN